MDKLPECYGFVFRYTATEHNLDNTGSYKHRDNMAKSAGLYKGFEYIY